MVITHGILLTYNTFDNLLHYIDDIMYYPIRKNKKINWKETKVYDNSNRGRCE